MPSGCRAVHLDGGILPRHRTEISCVIGTPLVLVSNLLQTRQIHIFRVCAHPVAPRRALLACVTPGSLVRRRTSRGPCMANKAIRQPLSGTARVHTLAVPGSLS